jgi:hypothetical protein
MFYLNYYGFPIAVFFYDHNILDITSPMKMLIWNAIIFPLFSSIIAILFRKPNVEANNNDDIIDTN